MTDQYAQEERATAVVAAPAVGGSSPWGRIDFVTVLAPGIVSVSTPSHGGIWLAPDRESTIPAALRAVGHQYAPAPWYEEDIDVCIVAVWFADELSAAGQTAFVEHCRKAYQTWPGRGPGTLRYAGICPMPAGATV
jgi:hypothetical protein